MESCVIAIAANAVEILMNASDSEESDDDEDFVHVFGNRGGQVNNNLRIENYTELIVPRMADSTFKSHFRLRRDTFDFLLNLLALDLQKQSDHYGRNPIAIEKQLLLVLWTMATPDSYRSVCDRFNLGKATAWRSVWKVVKAVYKHLPTLIKWPTHDEARVTWNHVDRKYEFPKVLGAIDGTYIKIAQPRENLESYINRKGFHSIQTQLVCDHKLRFLHVYAGEVGSIHDARVFRLSGIQNNCGPEVFPEDRHLLGGKAYCLNKYLMVPSRNNSHLDDAAILYNTAHVTSRLTIKTSIVLLKGWFRSLLDKLPIKRTDLIPEYIVACCIHHNICILRNDLVYIPILIDDDIAPLPFREFNNEERLAGIAKREQIKHQIVNP